MGSLISDRVNGPLEKAPDLVMKALEQTNENILLVKRTEILKTTLSEKPFQLRKQLKRDRKSPLLFPLLRNLSSLCLAYSEQFTLIAQTFEAEILTCTYDTHDVTLDMYL